MVQTWTAIGLMAATVFGSSYWLGSRIDALGGRIDALGGRIDGLSVRLDGINARLDEHIRHHS
jgi:hypothetical protein